ncbi:39S ribosomal protein L50, mitochondrial [Fukomys damarensis]|uniref:Large ribosomal subunit protein mL50 n=1 Tax=Fukomys damarensis TaxID=885580 RepID=A0A091CPE2_FUKDA|nr:39S ribosomal protein L50, mitochondrial [Fukomys damarensis]KFO19065.1 39S ribosomal protein L50, mitochondrial [Fukomys damarensis]
MVAGLHFPVSKGGDDRKRGGLSKLAQDWLIWVRRDPAKEAFKRPRLSSNMAPPCVSGFARRGLMCMVTAAARREFWSRSRKEKELVVTETEELKKEPFLVCPPLRSRTYIPPEDLQSHLESHIREIFGSSLPSNWQDISLEDCHKKFSLLAHLADDLGHAVPNSMLHQMCSVRDVLDFYNVPVQDRSKFDELTASNLPPNLKITWGY